MNVYKKAVRYRGYTKIELVIISLLSGVALFLICTVIMLFNYYRKPYFNRKMFEATLKEHLQIMRTAITQFSTDTGCYPATLTDLVATKSPKSGIDSSGKPVTIKNGSYHGPYLLPQGGLRGKAAGIPVNPFIQMSNDNMDFELTHHWTYANGKVSAAAPTSGCTLEGIPYSSL